MRNKVTNLLRMDKARYFEKKMEFNQENLAKVWAKLKIQIGWPIATSPKLLIDGTNYVTSPKLIANLINTAQIAKIKKISSEIDVIPEMYPYRYLLNNINNTNVNRFEFLPITSLQVDQILTEMKSSNSSGFDFLSPTLFKKFKSQLIPKLTHLSNSIISNCEYPQIFKCSKAIPILKPDKPPNEAESYRLINIQITTAKVID